VLSFGGRLLLAGRIPWFYVATVVWPCRLSFIYPRWDVDTAVRWQYLFPAGIVAVIVLLWLFRKRIGRGALAGVLFYLVTLFPALGFFNVYPMRFSFVADHFSYLADIGIFALAGATVQSLSSRCGSRCRVPVLAGAWVLIALCAFLTRERIRAYGNAETLWRDTLGKNREAWIAHNNLGEILVARGNIDEAVYHLSAALDLKPDIPEAHGNLANAFFKKGRYNEAVGQYRDMLELDPTNARAWHNMGFVLESVGRGDEAVIAYEEAIQLNPAYAEAYVRLAALLEKRGDSGRATGMYEKALELRPRWGKAMEGLRRLRGVSNGTRATGQGVSAGGGAL
jgi:tetratricopeptide (TPR) repeat protein